jgi:outer membrane immunogenic protein
MNTLKIAAVLTAFALTPVAAHAADFTAQPAAASAASNWDGLYIGAHLGYGWGTATITPSTSTSTSLSGFSAGVQEGYNFHLSDSVIASVEGDLSWNNEQGSFGGSTPERINWDGSVRGRLGLDLGQIMPYAEAGVAFANATLMNAYDETHTGWTVGAGVEFMLASNLSANVEYRYSDYGTQKYAGSVPLSLTDNSLRVGLNYHF